MSIKFSRSHQISLHECPRLAFLRYWDRGHGWESRRLNVAQSSGSLLHSTLASLMLIVKETDSMPLDGDVDRAINKAVADYRQMALQRGLDIEQQGDLEFELQRQSILVQGMVRGWLRVRLPQIVHRFRVVSVEEEWEIPLSSDVTIMIRIDCTLEDRESLDMWAMEYKSVGWMSDDWLEKWRYDSQTMLHAWALEKRFPERTVGGVLLEAFYKGTKRRDEATQRDIYYSPYLRAYRTLGVGPFAEAEWSFDSSMSRRKGWEVIEATSYNDVPRWVAQMPIELIQAQIYSIEVFRNPKDQAQWEAQTLLEMLRVGSALDEITKQPDAAEGWLLSVFPARLNADCYSNKFRRRCPFLQVCFNGIDPAETEDYMERVPHHTGEFTVEE